MPIFNYKIVKDNKTKQGSFEAQNEAIANEVVAKLADEVIYVKKKISIIDYDNKMNSRELIGFFSSISSLNKVGIDIIKSLEIMKDEVAENNKVKRICQNIYTYVASGLSLSEACAISSPSFTRDYVGLIALAEKTGNYSTIFEEIVKYIKWGVELKTKLKSATRGPVSAIIFVVGIIICLANIVLPKIIEFISYFNFEIPSYTRNLITFSNFVQKYWVLLVLIVLITYISLKIMRNVNNNIGRKIDYFKLKLPIIGKLILKLETTRFIRFFSLMYNNGADILTTLDGVANILSNKYVSYRVIIIRQNIIDGDTIFTAINKEKIFPVMFRKIIAICENTGKIDDNLDNVSYVYNKEVNEMSEKLVSAVKPTMTIILGFIVGWMGISMMGPIYSNIGSISDFTSKSKSY